MQAIQEYLERIVELTAIKYKRFSTYNAQIEIFQILICNSFKNIKFMKINLLLVLINFSNSMKLLL